MNLQVERAQQVPAQEGKRSTPSTSFRVKGRGKNWHQASQRQHWMLTGRRNALQPLRKNDFQQRDKPRRVK